MYQYHYLLQMHHTNFFFRLSRVRLFCDLMDCRPPDFSVHGIFKARILEWVAIPSPGDLPDSGIKPEPPALAGVFFTTEPSGKLY